MHEIMAGYWPTADQDPAAPSVLIRGDAVAEAARRKAQPGGGSIGVAGLLLASALASAGLIDGWHLYYVPIFPGSGKAAFSQIQNSVKLKPVEAHAFPSGPALLRCAPSRRHC